MCKSMHMYTNTCTTAQLFGSKKQSSTITETFFPYLHVVSREVALYNWARIFRLFPMGERFYQRPRVLPGALCAIKTARSFGHRVSARPIAIFAGQSATTKRCLFSYTYVRCYIRQVFFKDLNFLLHSLCALNTGF